MTGSFSSSLWVLNHGIYIAVCYTFVQLHYLLGWSLLLMRLHSLSPLSPTRERLLNFVRDSDLSPTLLDCLFQHIALDLTSGLTLQAGGKTFGAVVFLSFPSNVLAIFYFFYIFTCLYVIATEPQSACRHIYFKKTNSTSWCQSKHSRHFSNTGSIKWNCELCRRKFVASKGRELSNPCWGNLWSVNSSFTSMRAHMVHWFA